MPSFFTDEDLARRFIEQFKLPPCGLLPIPDRAGFVVMLEEAKKYEVYHVGFDIGSRTGRVFPVAVFREKCDF
jgi:hypothetical protein